MIRITRLDEACCSELAAVRSDELSRVRQALVDGEPLSERLIRNRYDVARQQLFEMQHYKCCYCETKQNTHKWETVEHFRPKCEVTRDGSSYPGYWWLAWTWTNLLFCCMQCNTYKGAAFPLAPGSTPLAVDELPPGGEQPLLLDPAVDDPREHIQFRPVGDSWWPFPRNGSLRGLEFLTRLKLYHPELSRVRAGLLSQWRAHAKSLEPAIARVRAALRSGSSEAVRAAWEHEVTPRLFTNQEFVALSIDVFDHAFDVELRARHALQLEPIVLPL